MDKLIEDVDHWQNLKPPLSPNEYEIEIYRHYTKGHKPICLLGTTKELIGLCDYMVDLNPTEKSKPVVKCDWKNFNDFSEVVIGDGVLNLVGIDLVYHLLKNSKKVVCRVFLKKLEGMKYAQYFPSEFIDAKLVIPTQKNVAIVVWEN